MSGSVGVQTGGLPAEGGARYHPLLAASLSLAAAVAVGWVYLTEGAGLYLTVTALGLLCFAPAWSGLQKGRIDYFETINVVGVIYFLFFGLGAIWATTEPNVLPDIHLISYVPRAALYCLAGYASLLIGYYASVWLRRERTTVGRVDLPRGPLFLVIPGLLGFAGYLAVASQRYLSWSGLPGSSRLSFLGQFAGFFLFSWALAWILLLSGRATRSHKLVLLFGLVPAAVLVARATTGEKSSAIILLGIPMMAYWYTRRKLPLKSLVVLVLITVFVIFPVYNTYRHFDYRLGREQRMARTMTRVLSWDSSTYQQNSLGLFKRRMANITSVAVLLRDTGRWVPFKMGERLLLVPISVFIPRFLWPDKPTITGDEFAEVFRMRGTFDRQTNIGVTIPGDFYWNFHLPGLVIGMIFWGATMRWAYRRFGQAGAQNPIALAAHMVLLTKFAKVGGEFPAALAGMIKFLVILAILCWVSRRFGLLESSSVAGAERRIPEVA